MASGQQLRVLVVDDNADQAQGIAYLIADMGHQADYAVRGRAALELARRLQPDVALLDLALPDTNGFELARELRRDPELKPLRIFGITGLPVDRDEARSRGFDDVLAKPLDPNLLEMLLRRAGR